MQISIDLQQDNSVLRPFPASEISSLFQATGSLFTVQQRIAVDITDHNIGDRVSDLVRQYADTHQCDAVTVEVFDESLRGVLDEGAPLKTQSQDTLTMADGRKIAVAISEHGSPHANSQFEMFMRKIAYISHLLRAELIPGLAELLGKEQGRHQEAMLQAKSVEVQLENIRQTLKAANNTSFTDQTREALTKQMQTLQQSLTKLSQKLTGIPGMRALVEKVMQHVGELKQMIFSPQAKTAPTLSPAKAAPSTSQPSLAQRAEIAIGRTLPGTSRNYAALNKAHAADRVSPAMAILAPFAQHSVLVKAPAPPSERVAPVSAAQTVSRIPALSQTSAVPIAPTVTLGSLAPASLPGVEAVKSLVSGSAINLGSANSNPFTAATPPVSTVNSTTQVTTVAPLSIAGAEAPVATTAQTASLVTANENTAPSAATVSPAAVQLQNSNSAQDTQPSAVETVSKTAPVSAFLAAEQPLPPPSVTANDNAVQAAPASAMAANAQIHSAAPEQPTVLAAATAPAQQPTRPEEAVKPALLVQQFQPETVAPDVDAVAVPPLEKTEDPKLNEQPPYEMHDGYHQDQRFDAPDLPPIDQPPEIKPAEPPIHELPTHNEQQDGLDLRTTLGSGEIKAANENEAFRFEAQVQTFFADTTVLLKNIPLGIGEKVASLFKRNAGSICETCGGGACGTPACPLEAAKQQAVNAKSDSEAQNSFEARRARRAAASASHKPA